MKIWKGWPRAEAWRPRNGGRASPHTFPPLAPPPSSPLPPPPPPPSLPPHNFQITPSPRPFPFPFAPLLVTIASIDRCRRQINPPGARESEWAIPTMQIFVSSPPPPRGVAMPAVNHHKIRYHYRSIHPASLLLLLNPPVARDSSKTEPSSLFCPFILYPPPPPPQHYASSPAPSSIIFVPFPSVLCHSFTRPPPLPHFFYRFRCFHCLIAPSSPSGRSQHKLEVVNSSPSRATTVQQTSNSKFHLPELKVGRQQQQQQQQQTSGVGGGASDAINSYDRKEQQKQPNPVDDAIARIDDAIAAAINGGGGSDEAMVRNGRLSATSSGSFSLSNDDFVRRLVEVVRREPALYDPSHEHYGNKHASAHFRSAIWQRLCKELDYPEDPHLLQMQWKRIREKYIRERRRRRGAVTETDSSSLNNLNAAARNFSAMGWLDDYLGDNANVARLNTAGPSTSGESYHEQTNHMNGGMVLKDVAGQQNRLALGGKGTAGPHMAKTVKKHTESTNGSSPSSTSSEISVGSAAAAAASAIAPFGTSGGQQQQQQQQHSTAILLPQLRHLPNNGNSNNFSLNTSAFNGTASTGGAGVGRLRGRHSHHAQIGHFGRQQPQQMVGGLSHQQLMYKLKEEELTGQQALQQHDVIGAATGVAPAGGLSMVSDGPSSSSAYQIISIPHDGTQQHSMATMGIEQQQPSGSGTSNFFQPIQSSTSTAQQHLPSTTTSIRGRKRPAALEVGQQQLQQTNRAHLFIDQAGDRIVLNQPTAVVQAPMLVQHQSPILQNASPHSQMHINPAALANHASRSCSSATFRVGHIGREQSTSTAGQQQQQQQQMPASLMAQPQYILSTASQQSHLYDVESAMIEMIVRHLGNLNDDEKVVTKMNIQRILMDARFGRGACVRMFREEEQSELSLEQQQRHMQQQQQQQQQQNSVNRR